jgi:hypothetical protein
VLLGLGVSVLLGHAKIHHMNHIGGFGYRTTDQEVVGFDVTVDEVLLMNGLNAGELLRFSARNF